MVVRRPRTVVLGAAPVPGGLVLPVASVSVSTRCQSDMRGLGTAGRTVRLQRAAGL